MHTIIAERVGLGATETKTLFILSSQGALTAGEIAQYTGLTTSSVTSLIDRLESKGFVKRTATINSQLLLTLSHKQPDVHRSSLQPCTGKEMYEKRRDSYRSSRLRGAVALFLRVR